MKRSILWAVVLCLGTAFAAGLAGAMAQGGLEDFGLGPDGLVFGDSNKATRFVASTTIEIRDFPNTVGGALSIVGGRFFRVVARLDDGDEFRTASFDYQCGEPAVADPCSNETICTIGNGNKEQCVVGQLVDVSKTIEIHQVVVSLLIPEILAAYGLPLDTTLENTKLRGFVQTNAVAGVDGIVSGYAMGELAFAE